MENVRVYELPKCKMVSSKCGMFGDTALDEFDNWLSSLPRTAFPQDYLWFDESQGGFVWYYIYHDGLEVPDSFDIVDFSGGLYAVACGKDGENNEHTIAAIMQFIEGNSHFSHDANRTQLGNVITPPTAQEALGYSQMDYYVPIKVV
ncbi:hypothetical protein [Enterococcus sp. BWR-S5]|uniref:hypothetical protein n=1 Tax=Enterococcus sp. BWR-S5 TaxID=2787714 RepID=UPI00192270E0|nr:hypothetical protein [Enterococcus sp. BWR-S5]MBL1224258.1 AraC family transcriptional regulator [Enterococcus sp. BWR-S5]